MTRKIKAPGFTLIELLVVIAIIGVLVAIALPAVNAARETGRRAQCQNQLTRLIVAVQNFDMTNRRFPSGVENPTGPIQSVPNGLHHNWLGRSLPFLGEGALYGSIDFSISVYDEKHLAARQAGPHYLHCPSLGLRGSGFSDYAAVHHDAEAPIDADQNGVFFLNSRVRQDDVKDGLSVTLFLGEKLPYLDDLGWLSGTRATLRNTGRAIGAGRPNHGELGQRVNYASRRESAAAATDSEKAPTPPAPNVVGGFDAFHPGGPNVAFGDGNTRLLNRSIDPKVLQQIGHRADGGILPID